MNQQKIAAIIPAYNEEENIGKVLSVFVKSKDIDEVIVIDDGSKDKTAQVANIKGVRVITQKNSGKGVAMTNGVKATDAEIIFFADADLINFSTDYIKKLLDPVLKGDAVMTVGLRDRGKFLVWFLPKIAPVLGGERAIKREIVEAIQGLKSTKDFGIETVMNSYCAKKRLPVRYIPMPDVTQVIKELKYGYWKGFKARMRMVGQILKAEWEVMRTKFK